MNVLISLAAVVGLALAAYVGVEAIGLGMVFGVLLPYAAIAVFIFGFLAKVIGWGKSPVPFRIPTTAGQQKSLPWIKSSPLESPSGTAGVIGRMALEVLLFRSLFRNTKTDVYEEDQKLVYGQNIFLWLGGMVFHYCFLVIFIRHYRFFAEPVPQIVSIIDSLDSFFQIGAPLLYLTDLGILAAATFLLLRRLLSPTVRYISLPADYFPLFVILGIALTGVWMRYFGKVDVVSIKQLAIGLVTFNPIVPEGIASIFFVHLFLVSTLFAYFPFSKLMHLGGVFMSPTRNLANNNRAVRHVNPWNAPVKVHTFEEYREDFQEVMKDAGYTDKQLES